MESRYDYVLIGSFAAVWAAQSIRERDKNGTIAIFGEEPHPPYDRPPLSKNYQVSDDYTADDAYSKYDDFYPKNDIDLHKATKVTQIDRAARTVTLASGEKVGYGKLLIATGSNPKTLNVLGEKRSGVHYLRRLDDAEALRKAMQHHKSILIVGTGYIGMEVAADARVRGLEVTVVDPAEHPWSRFASPTLGKFMQQYYGMKGVQFVLREEVLRIDGSGEDGPATGVTMQSGRQLKADFVLVAVGAALNTDLARNAGLEVDPQEGVKVNEFLQTADPNIWVAGDIAYFNDIALGKQWHAEHHLNAKWQGQAAGANMAGANQPYDQIPYFFSDEFDIHMILRGDPQGGKQTVVAGDLASGEFTELYYNEEGRLTMGIAISHDEPKLDPISDTLERLIRAKVNIKGREAEIQAAGFDLNSLA